MSIVATLDVPLRGDTSNIDAALSRTETRVKQFAGQADAGLRNVRNSFMSGSSSAGGALSQIGTAVQKATQQLPGFSVASAVTMGAVGAVTSAVIGKFQQLTESIVGAVGAMSALGPSAARLGLTTGQLAGLQHGAALAGVSVEELDHHFARFQKGVAEAMLGMGEAGKAFAQLNIEVGDFEGKAAIEIWERFADAIARTGNAADKIRIVDAIMGRGGDRLIPFLAQGSAGLRKMTLEAAALGPVSAASVAKVSESVVAWRRVQEAMSGLGRTIAVQLAPALTTVSEGVERAIAALKNLDINRETFNILARGALYAYGAINGLWWPVYTLTKVLAVVGIKFSGITLTWETFRDSAVAGVLMIEAAFENLGSALKLAFVGSLVGILEGINYLGAKIAEFLNWLASKATGGDAMSKKLADMENKRRKAINDADPGGVPLPMVGAEEFEGKTAIIAMFPKIDTKPLREAADIVGKEFKDALFDKFDAWKRRVALEKLGPWFGVGPWPEKDKPPPPGEPINASDRKVGAMLAGSKEAFETIYGAGNDYQAKALAVANDQLAENRDMRRLLEKIAKKRFGVDIGRADL